CAQAGLGRFGSVAIDGTKIAGNASAGANRSEDTLRAEAARILEEAAQVDAAEDEELGDARGDELPEQWANPTSRVARIRECLDNAEARLARAIELGIRPYELRKRSQMGNVTDPDTRLMPTRNGWVQGFNAQVAVTDDQLILATCVNNNPVDAPTFIPMMTASVDVAAMLANATGR